MLKNKTKIYIGLSFTLFLFLLSMDSYAAQTYNSGSTGADGVFAPTANVAVPVPPGGIFNFTTVNIPTGVTVTFIPNASNTSVTILAAGDVTISGTINLNGANGIINSSSGNLINYGGVGGPGGFSGGSGGPLGSSTIPSYGQGPGGGGVTTNGTYGAPDAFVSLIPLFGGSGGGGEGGYGRAGDSGGGGGGAIVIASSTNIIVNGVITAKGGNGDGSCWQYSSGAGSGGAIRLVASQLSGTGSLQAIGGTGHTGNPTYCTVGQAGDGRIRLEAYSLGFTGVLNPTAHTSVSSAPGPVTSASIPSPFIPTVSISSVAGVSSPATPGASFTTADVTLPAGTSNPVPIVVTTANIPAGTTFTLKIMSLGWSTAFYNTSPSTGTFSNSTAGTSVTLPSGQISLINAYASFTVPTQLAALYPLIDGEPVERVMVAANYGQASEVTFFTKSGKEMKADRLFKDLR